MPRRLDPIDEHVGSRLRLRRTLLGLSQERLGRMLDLTFQQIQKYERGANRIGGGRLFRLAHILQVDISYFFDDMPAHLLADVGIVEAPGFSDQNQEDYDDAAMARRETLELARAYYRITDPDVRQRVFDLVKAIAGDDDAAEAALGDLGEET